MANTGEYVDMEVNHPRCDDESTRLQNLTCLFPRQIITDGCDHATCKSHIPSGVYLLGRINELSTFDEQIIDHRSTPHAVSCTRADVSSLVANSVYRNWKGSPDGWYITPDNMQDNEPIRALPGLEGLRMVGHWTAPFMGTVMSALSGRQVIQLMCKENDRKFVTQ